MGFNKETTLQKHMIDFNHFGNVADRSSFNEEELRKSLEEMAKSLGAGATLPPFPTEIRPASAADAAAAAPNRSSSSPFSRRASSSSSLSGNAFNARLHARPFAQRNTDGGARPYSSTAGGTRPYSSSVGGGARPFVRTSAGVGRPTPFGRPFPKPFQRRIPIPRPEEDDDEIEEVVLD